MSEVIFITDLLELLLEVFIALVPLIIIFIIYQIFIFKLNKHEVLNIIKGFFMTFSGITLFLYGVKIGFVPTGKYIGEVFGNSSNNWVLILIGFILGFAVTLAEPAIRVLCNEIENASSGYIKEKVILFTLAFGVASSVAISMAKTIYGLPLSLILIPGYAITFVLAIFAGKDFTAIAFDSGGVATGPMVVTFIMSISIGLASSLEFRDPIIHGFGLVSLVALSPIISVLVLGIFYRLKEQRKK